MKSTEIVRKIDELGRIVIPKESRKILYIDVKDPIEIFTEGDTIILKSMNRLVYFVTKLKGFFNLKKKMFSGILIPRTVFLLSNRSSYYLSRSHICFVIIYLPNFSDV